MRLPPALVRTAARARPRIPQQVLSTLLSVGSFVPTDAPLVALPSFRRVMILAPHPDDETIGAGGTIARLAHGGATVHVLVATDGDATIGTPQPPAEVARRRRAEVATACRHLGARPPLLLGLPDGNVADHRDTLAARLQRHLLEVDPDVVFTPWPLERHTDHRACTAALAQVAPTRAELWGYEAHTPIPLPDRVVDITSALAAKRAALDAHLTAGQAFDLHACLGLARWRSLSTAAGRGAAEAFLTMSWAGLPSLVAAAGAAWRGEAG